MRVHEARIDYRLTALAFLAGAVLLMASLANFLTHSAYPLFRPEVGLLALIIAALSTAMALLYVPQRQWGRSFLEGLLAAVFVDLNSDSIPLIVLAGLGVAAFTFFRRQSLLGPLAVLGTVIFGTTIVGIGGSRHWINSVEQPVTLMPSDRPPLVHLILDEHIGLEGLPKNKSGLALQRDLRKFFLDAGFNVYGGAYSEHLHTINAIPNMLNYGERLARASSKDGVEIGSTRYFQDLAARGYRLTILQSDFADFCSGNQVSACRTYDSSSLAPTLGMPMATIDRAKLAGSKFISLSVVADRLIAAWNVVALQALRSGMPAKFITTDDAAKSSTVGALASLTELERQFRHAQPGEAYFAHLLLPHYPYVVDDKCRALPWNDWERRISKSPLEMRQSAYHGQVRCTLTRLERLLSALQQTPAGRNAIVVLHGDHGSRITKVDPNEPNRGKFDDADVTAGFSTLFALRVPGVAASYSASPQPVSSLLREFVKADFRAAPKPDQPLRPLRLDDWDWRPRGTMPFPSNFLDHDRTEKPK